MAQRQQCWLRLSGPEPTLAWPSPAWPSPAQPGPNTQISCSQYELYEKHVEAFDIFYLPQVLYYLRSFVGVCMCSFFSCLILL
ncbi:hypothetical protein JZ751_022474 [Albula glossodonta]|uniref:Uncharacterized protein n=1 Tax=Albula glossodonta TaxID=121402 RepID=A0A8T2NTY8_9TELE|nr:hypothetical protein JZ751_022474 [Albula glossodonta]